MNRSVDAPVYQLPCPPPSPPALFCSQLPARPAPVFKTDLLFYKGEGEVIWGEHLHAEVVVRHSHP